MLFHPAILALTLASIAATMMVAAAGLFAVRVLRHWDMRSGSELQIRLERRTYLISTIVGLAFAMQLASLLLFVFNADRMSGLFVGAMCAVGTLNVNQFGFPAIGLKIAGFFLAGLWLILNHLDNRGWDYPLIRVKYGLLLLIAPLLALETGVQTAFFLGLEADVITSCCGSLFSDDAASVTSELAGLEPGPALIGLFAALGLTLASGLHFLWRRKGAALFAALGGVNFLAGLAGMISVVSLYVYEHPHHHCPFCVIQPEYGYFGYAFYVPLFAATLLALGAGASLPFRRHASLVTAAPEVSRRLGIGAMVLLGLYGLAAIWAVAFSNLVLLD